MKATLREHAINAAGEADKDNYGPLSRLLGLLRHKYGFDYADCACFFCRCVDWGGPTFEAHCQEVERHDSMIGT